MTLDATGKFQNVKASVEYFLKTNLVTTSSLNVDFEGLPFEEEGKTEWVQERIMAITPLAEGRKDQEANHYRVVDVMLSLNTFVKKDRTTYSNRHYQIRDIIAGYLNLGTDVNLYDYANGNFTTSIQKMRVREIVTDSPIPNEDFHQYNYTVSLEWEQKWT